MFNDKELKQIKEHLNLLSNRIFKLENPPKKIGDTVVIKVYSGNHYDNSYEEKEGVVVGVHEYSGYHVKVKNRIYPNAEVI